MNHPDERYQTIIEIIRSNYKTIRRRIQEHDILKSEIILFKNDPDYERKVDISTIDIDVYPLHSVLNDGSIICIEQLHHDNMEFAFYKHHAKTTGIPGINNFYNQYCCELYFDAYDPETFDYYYFREEVEPYLEEIVVWFQQLAIEFI
jgi:hypothetical protein